MAEGVFDGRLRLADAPQPGDGLRQGGGRAGGQGGFKLLEDRLAAREVGIARVGDVPPGPPRGGQGARDGLRSWYRGQDLDRAEVGPGRGRLIGQVPVQGLVARVGQVERREPVIGMPPNGVGDVRGLRAGKQKDREEPRTAGLVVVDPVADQAPYPANPKALTRLLLAHDAAAVGLGADHQDELGLIEVPLHPVGPALRRRGVDVAVEDHVDPAVAQGIGQGEDAGGVLARVVAVTEEHPRRVRHRADPLRRSLVRPATACFIIRRTDADVQPGTSPRGRHPPQREGWMPRHPRGFCRDRLAGAAAVLPFTVDPIWHRAVLRLHSDVRAGRWL